MPSPRITVSIVSHRQNALVNGLLGDLARHCAEDILIVLTENVPDPVPFATGPFADRTQIVTNPRPKGFGANHNAAFAHCRTPFFCVANPDIRLAANPFPALLDSLQDQRIGVAGPLVRSPAGAVEDSARRFPTIGALIGKAFGGPRGPDYPADRGALEVDWVAGMFMLFRGDGFRSIGGFDEAYFLYYEDVDLCRRLRAAGKSVLYNPGTEVIHDARRGSHKDLGLMRHHAASILRFLLR
jgi:N-acetylglucosaminyl-diphospho-decaprenol L-rhamnosyltransferase